MKIKKMLAFSEIAQADASPMCCKPLAGDCYNRILFYMFYFIGECMGNDIK